MKSKKTAKKNKPTGLFQVNVDVGNMPPYRVAQHCEKLRKAFKKMKFDKKHGDVIFFPRRSDPGSNRGSEIIRIV